MPVSGLSPPRIEWVKAMPTSPVVPEAEMIVADLPYEPTEVVNLPCQLSVGWIEVKLTEPPSAPALGPKLAEPALKRSVLMDWRSPATPGALSGTPSSVRLVCDGSWPSSEIVTWLSLEPLGSVATLTPDNFPSA